jgi:hypothetical protein
MDIKLLCLQIQNLPCHYYSSILDIFIQHQCVVNETKRGSNKGVRVVLDYVPTDVLDLIQKRVNAILHLEEQNALIKNARIQLNASNPEPDYGTPVGPGYTSSPAYPAYPPPAGTPSTLVNKISALKIGLYQTRPDTTTAHRSAAACLWCTLPIPPFKQICIPIRIQLVDGDLDVNGYGSFCRPECAAGKLMNEPIDISTKYERYMLLNQLYMNQHNGTGIVPAVSPHYVMDKFLGTLTPDEYLEMTAGPTQYNILQKPFTHIMPELHEKYIIAHD